MKKRSYFVLLLLLGCMMIAKAANPDVLPTPTVASGIYTSLYGGQNSLLSTINGIWSNGTGGASSSDGGGGRKFILNPLALENNCYVQYGLPGSVNSRENGCNYFHVDLFFENQNIANQFRILFYASTPTGAGWGYAYYQSPVIEESKIGTQWISVDIPISELQGNTQPGYATKDEILADILNIRIINMAKTATIAQPLTVYVDNIYFYKKDEPVDPEPTSLIEPSRPASDIYSIYTDYTNGNKLASVTKWGTFVVAPYNPTTGKNAYKVTWPSNEVVSSGGPLYNLKSDSYVSAADLTKYTHVHVDVWSSKALPSNYLRLGFRDGAGSFGLNYNLEGISDGEKQSWKGYDIPLSQLVPDNNTKTLQTLLFQYMKDTGGGLIYMDNIYLYYFVPNSPSPSFSNQRVIWSGESTTPGNWSGNGTVRTSDGNIYQEINLGSGGATYGLTPVVNLETRDVFYVDVFSKELPSSFTITLSDGTNSQSKTITTLLANDWKTLQIHKDDFSGVNFNSLQSISFTGVGEVGIDNVIFYKEPLSSIEPSRPASEIYSIYTDYTGGDKLASVTKWDKFVVTPYNFVNGKHAYNVTWPSDQAVSSGAVLFNLKSDSYVSAADLLKYTHLHVDVWSSKAMPDNYLRLRLRDGAGYFGADTDSYRLEGISDGEKQSWKGYSIPLSSLIPDNNTKTLQTLLFQYMQDAEGGLIYMDNIYLYYEIPDSPSPSLKNQLMIWSGESATPGSWSGNGAVRTSDGNIYQDISLGSGGAAYSLTSTVNLGAKNMLYVDVFPKELPSSFTITVSDGTNSRAKTITTLSAYKWNTLEIPMGDFSGINLNSIKSITFSGAGNLGIDNILFYERDNPYPVARINNTYYYSIKRAVDDANEMTGDVDIQIIRSSIESSSYIVINKKDGRTSLKIYPTDEIDSNPKVITHTATREALGESFRSLFHFETAAENVTIDGRLNLSDDSPRSLVLQGTFLANNTTNTTFNSTIYLTAVNNITIANCLFQGKSQTDRAISAIRGTGKGIYIRNNYFENCMFQGNVKENDPSSVSVINLGSSTSRIKNTEISNNQFYEKEDLNYTDLPITHAFIKILYTSTESEASLRIVNNKIGGKGAGLSNGKMRIGHGAGAVSGSLWGIYINGTVDDGVTDVDNTTSYALIQGNEIGEIDILNREFGVYGDTGATNDNIGSFSGIYTLNALCVVNNNTIRNIAIQSNAETMTRQQNLFAGINSSISGSGKRNRAIVDGNKLYGFDVDFVNDNAGQAVMISAIYVQISSTADGTPNASIVRNNDIIMGHTGTHKALTYTEIRGINARIAKISGNANNTARLDLYNNKVVLNKFKLATAKLRSISAIEMMNSAETDKGIMNCYNNIVYVKGEDNSSFAGTTPVVGVSQIGNHQDGIVNIFHNSVLIAKDASLEDGSMVSAAMYYETRTTGKGTLNIWNNNFVNLNDNGSVYYTAVSNNAPKSFYFDYNNYYVPVGGNMMTSESNFTGYAAKTIKTFDNWKFSNLLPYLNKTTEHDHHSRFLYPCFNGTLVSDDLSIPSVNINNINTLRSLLVPKLFLGGKETDVTEATGLGLKILSYTVDPVTYIATLSTTSMSSNTNSDFGTTPSVRRQYLPTMGALNTSFSNYWTGTKFFDGITPNSDRSNPWERDIVFAKDATANYLMSGNMSVHDIYNDTKNQLRIQGYQLTVTGYIGLEENKGTVLASQSKSTIVYAGADGHSINSRQGAGAQHIFNNTFLNDQVNNIVLDNKSEYFVLLHASLNNEPALQTLTIRNDFSILSPNETVYTYPDNEKGLHLGGLNCTWYKTHLRFLDSTNPSANDPVLANTYIPTGTTDLDKSKYRPYLGQRIPRHGIYNDEVYFLEIAANKVVTYHDYLYVRNALKINSGKSFEIAADKYVQVDGLTTNSNNYAGLIIRSQELYEKESLLKDYLFPVNPRPNATFIFSNPAASPVNATVEMYSPANKAGTAGKYQYRWQYFVPAVTSAAVGDYQGAEDILRWNPEGDIYDPDEGSPYWKRWSSSLTNTMGYSITQDAPAVYTTKGTLTNQTYTVPMTYHVYPKDFVDTEARKLDWVWTDQVANSGKYVLGNPYTAAIDISKIDFGTNGYEVVYIFNTGNNTDWVEQGSGSNSGYIGDAPGQNIVVPKNWAGKKIDLSTGEESPTGVQFPQFISSMQGFTICFDPAKPLEDGVTKNSFILNYDITSGSSRSIGKNDGIQRSSVDEPDMSYMLIELADGEYKDKLFLATHPDCKKGFDNGWDGHKTVDLKSPAQIFTVEREETTFTPYYYQVSTLDDLNDTRLSISVGDPKQEYSLTVHHSGMENKYTKMYLEDIFRNKKIDITESGKSYQFTESSPNKVRDRFRIITSDDPLTSEDDLSAGNSLIVYSSGKTIKVINEVNSVGEICVYDVMGKLLLTQSVDRLGEIEITTQFASGIYLVKASVGHTTINKSIILH